MGNKVHTLFTPEPNSCYCDNIMGPERSTQRSKTKECKRSCIRVMSSICSVYPTEQEIASPRSVCGELVRYVRGSWRLLRCDCEGKNSCTEVVFCCGRIQWKCNAFLFTMNGDERRPISCKNAPKPKISVNTSICIFYFFCEQTRVTHIVSIMQHFYFALRASTTHIL